jgi:hypothetical protein
VPGVDWNTAQGAIAIAVGNSLGAALYWRYIRWRAARASIRFRETKSGEYEDSILLWERVGRIWLYSSLVLIVVTGGILITI